MKRLMFVVLVVFSFVVLAQEAAGSKAGGRDGFRRGARAGDRGSFFRGERSDSQGDRAVWAVMNPRVAEKIGLSEEVRAQLKKIEDENRAKIRDFQEKIRVAIERQSKLMRAEKIDEAAVMAAIDELFECRKEMAKTQTKRLISVKSLLTPEQIAKATEVMKELRSERMSKRANRLQKDGDKGGVKPEAKDADAKPAAESAK